jgi:hypothetical protein
MKNLKVIKNKINWVPSYGLRKNFETYKFVCKFDVYIIIIIERDTSAPLTISTVCTDQSIPENRHHRIGMFWLKPRLGDAHKVKTDNVNDRVEFINSLNRTGSIEVTKTKASIITMAIRGLEDNISKHSIVQIAN